MAFFNYIVFLSIKSLIIIPLVIAIRFLIDKYPKKYSYILWIAVFISLVVKIDVRGDIDTPISMAQNTIQHQYNSVLNSYTGDISIYHSNTEEYAQAVQQGIKPIISEEAKYVITAKDTYTPPATVQSSYMPKVQIVWLAGIMAFLIVYIKNIIDIISTVKFSVYYRDNICYSENIKSPFVFGVIKPKIYLPYSITPQQEAAVIAHENVHIKRLDYIVKPVCYFITLLHWFNPMVWVAFYLLTKDMELSCDEAVVKNCNEADKKNYCTALLQFALKDKNYKIGTLMFGESDCSSRIKNVLSFKQPKKIIAALLVFIVAAISVVAITEEKKTEENIAENEMEHSTETNTERDPALHFTHDIETEDSLPADTFVESFIWPTETKGTYVSRGFAGQYPAHDGLDIAGKQGTEIYAAADGTVNICSETNDRYGNYIVILHDDGYRTLYAHCDKLLVKSGETVKQGQLIATIGSTGYSTGNHLHFGISKDNEYINTEEFLNTYPIDVDCGICGGQMIIVNDSFGEWIKAGQTDKCTHGHLFGTDLILERGYIKTTVCRECNFGNAELATETIMECHGY